MTATPTDSLKHITPQPGFQTSFVSTVADIAFGGGSAGAGKSYALLMDYLNFSEGVGNGGVIFRRTTTQITAEGGLWDTSVALFSELVDSGRPVPIGGKLTWNFPNGNKLKFSHLQHAKNITDWQGTQIPYLAFDELTHFTKKMFFYLISRSRSSSGYRPRVRCTMNPEAEGWVKDMLVGGGYVYPDDYHNEALANYPVAEMSGVIRYFVRYKGDLIWGDSRVDVARKIPASVRKDYNYGDIKSFTFIPGKLYENPILLKDNPGYRGNLLAQSEEDQVRLLDGRWTGSGDDRLKLISTPALRDLFTNSFVPGGAKVLTADIATQGSDELVVRIFDGWRLTHTYAYAYTLGDEILKIIKDHANEHGIPLRNVVFDAGGVGNYLKGFLRSSIGVIGSEKPYLIKDIGGKMIKPNFKNLRSQLAFYAAQKIEDYEAYADLDRNEGYGKKLYDELAALYKKNDDKDGKRQLEPRDLLKIRLGGKSPDHADSFNLRSAFDLYNRPSGRRNSSSG